jgi:hypothetical protein
MKSLGIETELDVSSSNEVEGVFDIITSESAAVANLAMLIGDRRATARINVTANNRVVHYSLHDTANDHQQITFESAIEEGTPTLTFQGDNSSLSAAFFNDVKPIIESYEGIPNLTICESGIIVKRNAVVRSGSILQIMGGNLDLQGGVTLTVKGILNLRSGK